MVQTFALLGTYVPRRCGIATFTHDLRQAIAERLGQNETRVLAMDDSPDYDYPAEVRFQIPAQDKPSYKTAAELLNINQIDVVSVQHEYGIFGGKDGSYVLDLMRRLRMPVISTLHTVLREPSAGQKAVLREIASVSDRVVVMSHRAVEMLERVYAVPRQKVVYIPHGIPDVPFVDPSYFKDQFQLEGRKVMLTFGLLSPGKGIEVAIEAMPKIAARHPDVMYVVLGATHPHVLKNEGNAYRVRLERLVDKLGVRDHVVFHNRFVSLEELIGYIGAADIYVTPYPGQAQITSGTLAYALGMGKAVVSTPYVYAQEMLADGRGRLFPFGDSAALAEQVCDLLDNEVERHAMRKRAYLHCRPMVWPEVARAYVDLAKEVVRERRDKPRPVFFPSDRSEPPAVPEVDLSHLRRLTDDTGILQHAIYLIPDRNHGYCTDDNARALVATLLYHDLSRDDSVLPLAHRYLAFLHHAFNPKNKRFRNFMTYDRVWTEEQGSEDVHGRAIWSLGLAAAMAPNNAVLSFATRLLGAAFEQVENLGAPRAWAFALVGIHAYLQRFSGDTHARRIRSVLANRLYDAFVRNASPDWPWCEDIASYDNAKLPHALILSGQWIPDHRMTEQGLRSLEWLVDKQVAPDGMVSLIGNRGWITRQGERARFDQQPIEAMALIEACAEAHRCTQDPVWIERARQVLGWFLGNNETHSVLYDFHTGGCRDGLQADGPNLNQGAESTLAWLISLITVVSLSRDAEAGVIGPMPAESASNNGGVRSGAEGSSTVVQTAASGSPIGPQAGTSTVAAS